MIVFRIAAVALFFAAPAARAQAPAPPGRPPLEASYRSGYIGAGRLSEGGSDSGKASELQQDWRLDARHPLGDGRLTFGAFYRRTDIDRPASELIPDTLQLFRAAFGYERSLSPSWLGAVSVAPSVAGDRHVDARGVSVAGSIIATSVDNPRRTWVLGLGVDPRGPFPVLPFVGAILRPSDAWTVRLLVPEFSAARKTGPMLGGKSEAKAGLRFSGAGYLVSSSFGSARGRPDVDSRWLRTQTLSAETGLGIEWERGRAELTAGYAFLRRYEYRDAGARVSARGAPTVGLSVMGKF